MKVGGEGSGRKRLLRKEEVKGREGEGEEEEEEEEEEEGRVVDEFKGIR